MRLPWLVTLVALVGGCARDARPEAVSAAPVHVPSASAQPTASSGASDAGSPPSPLAPRLRFDAREDGLGSSECDVVDEATGVVGHATSTNTAAGGSTVTCYDHLHGGKIIRFANSRGIYAKDARPGAADDRALPCGEGVFARDVRTCVQLDAPAQVFGETTADAQGFDVRLCSAAAMTCTTLVAIRRGMNRIAGPLQHVPRWWDVRYCSDDRLVVVGEGALMLFDVPSGKLLATAAAPDAVRVERCEDGVAETRSAAPNGTLRFKVEAGALTPSGRTAP